MRVSRLFSKATEAFHTTVYLEEEEANLLEKHIPSPIKKWDIEDINDTEFKIKPVKYNGGCALMKSGNGFCLRQTTGNARRSNFKTGFSITQVEDDNVKVDKSEIWARFKSQGSVVHFDFAKDRPTRKYVRQRRSRENSTFTAFTNEVKEAVEKENTPSAVEPKKTEEKKNISLDALIKMINQYKKIRGKNMTFSTTQDGYLEVLVRHGPDEDQ